MARIQHLIEKTTQHPGWVVYWMQQSQRIDWNHALKLAIELANKQSQKLLVVFGLTMNYPSSNRRHYHFMAQNLEKLRQRFLSLNIRFVILQESPDLAVKSVLFQANTLVMDIGYTKIQRQWRKQVYDDIIQNHPQIDLYSIESDVIVPVRDLSNKEEYAARTIRPKCWRSLKLEDLEFQMPEYDKELIRDEITGEIHDSLAFVEHHKYPIEISLSHRFEGGEDCAIQKLDNFVRFKLNHYLESTDPSTSWTSELSPYLHFGMISPLYIFGRVRNSDVSKDNIDAFLEQLFVRRELAINFIYYHPDYDKFDSILEPWAKATLEKHQNDQREYLYTIQDYLSFSTHDKDFNAAMKEMVRTGFMHNYMRMYWAKKIIEWSNTPKEAFETITFLNDTYFLDGRDANSYAGIAWCFGKHDRPWTERNIFGSIRYMNQAGLRRKFDMRKYCEKVDFLSNSDPR